MLYALGLNGPLFPPLYRLLPALGWVRVPPRALFLVALAVNLLATFGADVLLSRAQAPHARRWAMRLAAAGLLTFAGLGIGFAALYGRQTPPALFAGTAAGAALCAIWLLSLWPRAPRALLQALLLIVLIVDLWPVGRSLIEQRPAKDIFGQGAAVALYLSERSTPGGPSRIYSPSYSVPQHIGVRLGLEQLNGIDPLQLSWAAHYVNLAAGIPQSGYSVILPHLPHGAEVQTALRAATPDAALLGALNACVVVAQFPIHAPHLSLETLIEGAYIYRNERCLPRAYLVARVQLAGSWQEAQAHLQGGFDPAKGALVEGGETLSGAEGWTGRDRTGTHAQPHRRRG